MASVLKVDKLDPQSGTALEIGTSGDTISIPSGATLDISASTLTPPATMPASSGINFTALNATNLGSGTVPTARLGTGTASSSVFLAGDNTWAAAGGGKIGQVIHAESSGEIDVDSDSSFADTNLEGTITPSATSSKILVIWGWLASFNSQNGRRGYGISLERAISGGATSNLFSSSYSHEVFSGYGAITNGQFGTRYTWQKLDSPSTTSAITYKPQAKTTASGDYVQFNGQGMKSDLILMEVLS